MRPLFARRADEDVDDGLPARGARLFPEVIDVAVDRVDLLAREMAGQDEIPVRVPERALFGAEHARRLPPVPLPEQRPGHILHERIRKHTHSATYSQQAGGPAVSLAANACRICRTSL